MVLHLNKFESPSPKDALIVPSLVEIGTVDVKVYDNASDNDYNDDDDGKRTHFDQ